MHKRSSSTSWKRYTVVTACRQGGGPGLYWKSQPSAVEAEKAILADLRKEGRSCCHVVITLNGWQEEASI